MTVTPMSWPSLEKAPIQWDWKLIANTATWTSPFDGGGQTLEFPGSRWWCRMTYDPLRHDGDARVLDAFLASMRGMSGRVLMPMYHAKYRRGVATGTPVVDGADQTGRSLVTAGWTQSTPLILRVGDHFSVATASGPELKIITADVASDSAGAATLAFEPPLRSSPADGAALNVSAPVCPMRLLDNDQGEISLSLHRVVNWTGQFVEAWL